MSATPRFCFACGGALERRLILDRPRLVCSRCGEVTYLDAKVAASTVTRLDDGRVVLVRRSIEPGYGLWVMPGGFVERGETVADGAVRETYEEIGLEVAVDGLLGVYSYPETVVVVVVYTAHPVGGRLLRASAECMEVRAFAPDEIPWDAIAFKSSRDALTTWTRMLAGTKPAGPAP